MSQYIFGSGYLIGKKIVPGSTVVTPRRFGELQDVTVDFSAEIKLLHGQNQFAAAAGRGKGTVSIKAKVARVKAALYNDLFLASVAGVQTGRDVMVVDEPHPAAISVPVTNTGAAFKEDLGVVYAATGLPLDRVAPAAEATGKYSVSATGTYVFGGTDVSGSAPMLITYTWRATTGVRVGFDNQLMGLAPASSLWLANSFNAKGLTMKFTSVMSNKLSIPMTNEDFSKQDLEFSAFDDGTGSLGEFGFDE